MNFKKYELSIGIERVDNNIFLSLNAVGMLAHEDYEPISPVTDSALNKVKMPKVDVLIDGTEMENWELIDAWDDLKHGSEFEKIAKWGKG